MPLWSTVGYTAHVISRVKGPNLHCDYWVEAMEEPRPSTEPFGGAHWRALSQSLEDQKPGDKKSKVKFPRKCFEKAVCVQMCSWEGSEESRVRHSRREGWAGVQFQWTPRMLCSWGDSSERSKTEMTGLAFVPHTDHDGTLGEAAPIS